jgi:AcrR family transcriptional regulator
MARRARLDAERIIDAAVAVADEGGLAKVSMRNVARQLGVEAMSLYHHVDGKDALLDAMVDHVFTLIELPPAGSPWRTAMHARATTARQVLGRHPWALGLIESRSNAGEANLAHHDGVLGLLRGDGFSVPAAAHAYSVLDAYVFGFVLTEQNLPFDGSAEGVTQMATDLHDHLPEGRFPHLVEFIAEHVMGRAYEYGEEFDVGLDLILDGLERLRDQAT